MAVVKPFKGFRYNQTKIKKLEDVVVPPYDVISPSELVEMKAKSSYNYSNLILSGDSAIYKKAADLLQNWREEKVLIQDVRPCLYFYKQTFKLDRHELFCQIVPDSVKKGGTLSRTGIFSRVGLEDYTSKIILPHEKTFAVHKADRYKLMEATMGNMEPVFLGYDSDRFSGDEFEKITLAKAPVAHYSDCFGVEHKLWSIDDTLVHETVEKTLSGLKFYILDGHHRYETALQFYKDHQSSDARLSHRYVLADICSFRQPGTIILPTHRLISGIVPHTIERTLEALSTDFEISKVVNFKEVEEAMSATQGTVFGVRLAGDTSYLVMKLKKDSGFKKQGELDLDILHEIALPKFQTIGAELNINYVKAIQEWESRLNTDEFQIGFLIKPTTSDEVMKVAQESRKMPHKSTFFYPKIPSGLVINIFD